VVEGRLGPASVNRSVIVLAGVLDEAVEYGHLAADPAKSKRRRLPAPKPARRHLEPEQVRACSPAQRSSTPTTEPGGGIGALCSRGGPTPAFESATLGAALQ
jgi:hypothetical protein